VVRVYPVGAALGSKAFAGPGLDPGLWTDDGSAYFELWGGLLPTFWNNATLDPGASVGWTERWYAVSGIGGYDFANENGAVRLTQADGRITLALATTTRVYGTAIVRQSGQNVARISIAVAPGHPLRQTVGSSESGPLGVQVIDTQGTVVLVYSVNE